MATVEEIEKAITDLPPSEFWRLTDRLIARREDAWDRQIDQDAMEGKLDFLFEEADKEATAGRLVEWPGQPDRK